MLHLYRTTSSTIIRELFEKVVRFFIYSTFNKENGVISGNSQVPFCVSRKIIFRSSSCFHAWLNMTKFVNNSSFGKNKAIKIAKRLSAIFFDVQICR